MCVESQEKGTRERRHAIPGFTVQQLQPDASNSFFPSVLAFAANSTILFTQSRSILISFEFCQTRRKPFFFKSFQNYFEIYISWKCFALTRQIIFFFVSARWNEEPLAFDPFHAESRETVKNMCKILYMKFPLHKYEGGRARGFAELI